MTDTDWLADGFEQNRGHLRAVAYRMLGSLAEVDDAVQEAWLRVSRSGAGGVDNLDAWLTTVVARVCLNALRSRKARREEPLGVHVPEPIIGRPDARSPEDEALLADSVGLALYVVFETLTPAERLAFVLHDMFDLPFDEIAPMTGRSAATARQLASRARRRVRGAEVHAPDPDLGRQREVVDAFFAAARQGDLDALVAVLHPDVVLRSDGGTAPRRHRRGARSRERLRSGCDVPPAQRLGAAGTGQRRRRRGGDRGWRTLLGHRVHRHRRQDRGDRRARRPQPAAPARPCRPRRVAS